MICDAMQNVSEPDIGFDTMHFASTEQGVEHATSFGGFKMWLFLAETAPILSGQNHLKLRSGDCNLSFFNSDNYKIVFGDLDGVVDIAQFFKQSELDNGLRLYRLTPNWWASPVVSLTASFGAVIMFLKSPTFRAG